MMVEEDHHKQKALTLVTVMIVLVVMKNVRTQESCSSALNDNFTEKTSSTYNISFILQHKKF